MSEQPCYSERSAADQQTVSIEPGAPRWIVPHFRQTSIGAVLFTPNPSGRLETSPRVKWCACALLAGGGEQRCAAVEAAPEGL